MHKIKLRMYGRIARIQVLWVDRTNPTKVSYTVNFKVLQLL